ncbi:Predicted arabinose efflux permease, MFS family [Halopseudomonas xinjiangensis]|uniref:Predicted arabinose efflux permease, MFS family n=1 Tax=Halopseudomonas xinjiangensis TaxID=487184 RepID=A0A1H1MDB3_9GAMM|nr:MFS transporter [Halopseudomonas xinjiangensis]SDR84814.1 Predicted arabinose efflux permease, MFS family [Halopseudomonas xinjiangensis]
MTRLRLPGFIRENPSLGLFALLCTAGSGFGQTFLVGIFGDALRSSFGLSHSLYGLLYSTATLCSAALLLRLGGLVDRWALPRVTLMAGVMLAAGCLMLGGALHALMVWLGFFLVRFGGQAMLSHIGMSTAGRYFALQRGKAVAFAASGYPLSEAVLPMLISVLIALTSWRWAWVASGLIVLLALLPVLMHLSAGAEHPETGRATDTRAMRGKTRAEVLADPVFYLLLPATIAVPFIVTALLFHQAALAGLKGWSPDAFAAVFVAYGAGHLASLLIAGPAIDRIGAQRMLPLALLPMLGGLITLAPGNAEWVPVIFLGLTGLSQGAINATLGALWPERYGIRHIGAIRSVMQAIMVLSTALAPIVLGFMLDAAVAVNVIIGTLALATALAALLAQWGIWRSP